jgi:hypothetical protein
VSGLLLNAFRALGPGPRRREVALVATALRGSGDADEVGRLLNYEENPGDWGRCCEIADEAGASGFVRIERGGGLGGRRASTTRRGGLESGEDRPLGPYPIPGVAPDDATSGVHRIRVGGLAPRNNGGAHRARLLAGQALQSCSRGTDTRVSTRFAPSA